MDVSSIVQFVTDLSLKFPWAVYLLVILSGLGSLVVLAQALVVITPSQKDNEILDSVEKSTIGGFLFKVLTAFSPIKKK
jgi:hypothetical protein